MNANELADEIEQGKDGFRRDVIVTMLRHQQAEIANLKHMNLNWQISEGMLLSELDALKEENAKMKTKLIGHGLVKALDNFGKAQEK